MHEFLENMFDVLLLELMPYIDKNYYRKRIDFSLEQIITNGAYKSVEHRAIINSKRERISIATFYGPGGEGHIGPLPSIVGPEKPALFKTLTVADYYKGFVNKEGTTKSYVDCLRIQNEDITP